MTLQSMTGFARTHGRVESGTASGAWVWELRSVNSKGLEIRLRLPTGFETLESESRKILHSHLSRGNIQASLQFERETGSSIPVVNEAALAAVLAATQRIGRLLGAPAPRAETILQIKGVLESGESEVSPQHVDARNAGVLAGLAQAAALLEAARQNEGTAVVAALMRQVEQIDALVAALEADPSRSAAAIRERLRGQLAQLLDDANMLDPQRLHQEAAILATKADIREEIDRLQAHVAAARTLLAGPGPAGRKLDFLSQEFNRECNTVCSKANAAAVTSIGLEMKIIIDQFREQVQNIE